MGLGTAVLIIVLSVMNGFENELRKRILGVIPHVTLESSGGFEDIENISKSISEDNEADEDNKMSTVNEKGAKPDYLDFDKDGD